MALAVVEIDGAVSSLLDSAARKVLQDVDSNEEKLSSLPTNIKDKLLHLMSIRGLLTDTNIQKVLHRRIRMLDLSECDISDSTLSVIAQYGQMLQKIDLNAAKENRTQITSLGISQLSVGCPYLQVIYLRRCLNITDDAVIDLANNCPHIREFNLAGCHLITDRSLLVLGEKCHRLSCINVSRTSITDEGVFALVNGRCSETLKEVHLAGCQAITDEAVEAVTNFCPNINILIFHSCPNLTERSRSALEELGSGNKMKQVTWTIY